MTSASPCRAKGCKRRTRDKRGYQHVSMWALRMKAKQCEGCGIHYADPPSKLCPGCEAYREHTNVW